MVSSARNTMQKFKKNTVLINSKKPYESYSTKIRVPFYNCPYVVVNSFFKHTAEKKQKKTNDPLGG
jgi:hypothetical protein